MGASRFSLLPWAALLANACAISAEDPEVRPIRQALSDSQLLVTLRTFDQSHYLTAEADGGGTVSADRSHAASWERWVLSDLDGAPLESGDSVQLRHVSAGGTSFWMVADVNGGGPGSVLRADRTAPAAWETFILEKPGGGAIASGDPVQLRASSAPYYVCAERGGGLAGDGSVVVDRALALTWETFTLDIIEPSDLCPSDSLCLFDRRNFDGARFEVKALDPDVGACIDLIEHGWGARARSAVNTNSKNASLKPNPDCTGEPVPVFANDMEPTLPLLPDGAFVF